MKMNIGVKLSLIGVVVGALVVNQALKTQGGSTEKAFGWSGPKSQLREIFCADAVSALTDHLETNNFAAATAPEHFLAGLNVDGEERRWFKSTSSDSLPYYVCLVISHNGSSALECDVMYRNKDYRWRVRKTAEAADETVKSLADWWDNYQSKHPIK